jgi:hypothetical protein
MKFIKKAWLTFRQLKTWLQIIIILVAISLLGAIGGSGSSSTESGSSISTSSESLSSPSPEATPEESVAVTPAVSDKEFKSALSKMRIKNDSVKNLKNYRDKSSPIYVNANGFFLSVTQVKDSDPGLYLEIRYTGEDWLFIESFFFNIDGDTYEITPGYGEIETDNDSTVWEWYSTEASSENIEMIQKIINSKKTVMRLEGSQYHKDVTITQTQKNALRSVLAVYQGLGGVL